MFEHLDDPVPFLPDAALRTTVVRAGRRRRNRRRTAVSAASVGLPMAVLAGTVGAVRWKADQARPVSVGAAPQTEADGRPAELNLHDLSRPFTLLAVGTDGDGRSDAIMVIEVDRPAGTVRIVSVPRDLHVPQADGSASAPKLADNLARDVEKLITTVNQLLGVTIDHYLAIDLDGFAPIADAAGGIPVVVEQALRDRFTGLALEPGCQTLDGATALNLARSRRLEVRAADGTWTADGSNEAGRSARQQVLAAAAMARAGHLQTTEALLPLGQALVGNVRGDADLDIRQSGELTMWVGTLPPEALRSMTVPVVRNTVEQAEVLELAPGASADVRRFLAGENVGAGSPPATAPGGAPVHAYVRSASGGAC